ncbi:hypothetical protein BS50DRAFT_217489 [Corynespora cassiicola Philippines]|uniref:Uncharacterized protein n=1 Tax=Corynespora cassiicola Philippines TaxID=1448308 RepID=A0A2T2N3P7_CORCC|nr:hypothetical protein BS50DRAFT_217489 [Corynespora cassiicola Philippines]
MTHRRGEALQQSSAAARPRLAGPPFCPDRAWVQYTAVRIWSLVAGRWLLVARRSSLVVGRWRLLCWSTTSRPRRACFGPEAKQSEAAHAAHAAHSRPSDAPPVLPCPLARLRSRPTAAARRRPGGGLVAQKSRAASSALVPWQGCRCHVCSPGPGHAYLTVAANQGLPAAPLLVPTFCP